MNVSLSSIRTALHELEAAVESGLQPSKEHPAEGHDASSAVRAAGSDQKPVNFASPSDPASSTSADPARTQSADPASASGQADPLKQFMDVIMKAIMQFLQSLQHKDEGSTKASAPVSAAKPAGASPSPAAASASPAAASSPASAVSGNPGLSAGDELHLPPALEPYRADIQEAAKATGMPAKVIAGQIWAESRGNLGADSTNVNGKTDAGLMQVNADTFAELKRNNPALLGNANVNNAHDNIMAGALYLRDQSKAFGNNIGAGLRAYNSGPDKVNVNNLADTGGVGDPQYAANVLRFAEIIGSGKGQLPA